MHQDLFWERVAAAYETQPEAVIQRTCHSLRSRWCVLQRLVQKYLAADKLYRANIPSCEVEADTQENVMLLYMANNQATTKKGKSDPPVFKSVPAAFLLRGCPKFSAKIGVPTAPNAARGAGGPGESSSRSGCAAVAGGQVGRVVDGEREVGEGDGGEEAVGGEWGGGRRTDERGGGGGSGAPAEIQEGVAAVIPCDSPSARRPAGAKRQKLADGQRKEVRSSCCGGGQIDG